MDGEFPHWRFYDSDDEPVLSSIWEVGFGRVVLSFLNQINRIKNDGESSPLPDDIIFGNETVLLFDEKAALNRKRKVLPKLEDKTDDQYYDDESNPYSHWMEHYNIILDAIESNKNESPQKQFDFYNRYKSFAACFLNNLLFYPNKTDDVSPSYKNPSQMIGYRIMENGIKYEVFKVNGYEEFFALDLWELLFNPNTSILIRRCRHCGDFFRTNNQKIQYCQECRPQKDKINNAKYRKNPIYILKKSIIEKIERNNKILNKSERRAEFETEYNYYCDIIKNGQSSIACLPSYRSDIHTKEDLIAWLKGYENELRVYKKK